MNKNGLWKKLLDRIDVRVRVGQCTLNGIADASKIIFFSFFFKMFFFSNQHFS